MLISFGVGIESYSGGVSIAHDRKRSGNMEKSGRLMKYRAIIFDLDGVICYTDRFHYQAWKKIADEEGIYFDEEINRRLRGVSRMESLNIILERAPRTYTQEEKNKLCERKNEIYVRLLGQMNKSSLSPATKATLEELRRMGLKMAIGSSSKNAKLILKRLGLDDFFDGVADGTIITHSKPHPEVFIKALDMLGERPYESLVVEDSKAGIDAAYLGGFASIGIGDAKNNRKATYKIDKFSDILDIVRQAG